MNQTAIALLLVLFAVVYLAYQVRRFWKLRQEPGCGKCAMQDEPPSAETPRELSRLPGLDDEQS